jgi:DNA-binding transcriptional ArsR family regulator
MRARDNVAVIEAATTILGMLADPTRLRLMARLRHGEQDVTALTAAVGAARPAVSQHLGKLRLAGLVRVRRDGRRQMYGLADAHVGRLVTEALHTAEHRVSARPAHHDPGTAVPVQH